MQPNRRRLALYDSLFNLLGSCYIAIFPSLAVVRKCFHLYFHQTAHFQQVVLFYNTCGSFYRLFPQEWPAHLLPASCSYCGPCRSGAALHLQEGVSRPLPKRKPHQPSKVTISKLIIVGHILNGTFMFSVNYCHIWKVFFLLKGLAILKLLIRVDSQITMLGIQQYRLLLLG